MTSFAKGFQGGTKETKRLRAPAGGGPAGAAVNGTARPYKHEARAAVPWRSEGDRAPVEPGR